MTLVIFSKLKVNELRNLNRICRDLVQQGHGSLIPFIASAGRQQTCLPSWREESSARVVYARYVSSKILWGHFWLGIVIQDKLPGEPQTGSLAYSSVAVRNGTKKTLSSLSKFYVQQHAGCCFCCTSMQGQIVLKVYGNLNKGASGNMTGH